MKRMNLLAILTGVILVLTAGCNIPMGIPVVDGLEEATQTETVALPISATATLTLTPEPLTLTVSTATFCRTGPGTVYDLLGTLPVGQEAEVIGQNIFHDTWVIKFPGTPSLTCWLWGQYATLSGSAAGVPVIDTPPTPTPTPDFSFSYRFWGVGPGYQCIYFDVTDTGGTTWQSYTLNLLNVTQAVSGSRITNTFIRYDDWCLPVETLQDLTPGESGTASVVMHMPAAFTGNTFNASLTLCSGDDQTGFCVTKALTFVP
jgi:hypothetical protein